MTTRSKVAYVAPEIPQNGNAPKMTRSEYPQRRDFDKLISAEYKLLTLRKRIAKNEDADYEFAKIAIELLRKSAIAMRESGLLAASDDITRLENELVRELSIVV